MNNSIINQITLTQLPPLGLYIHIPWCIKKCPYCDFNSHTIKGNLPEEEYIKALITDLELALPKIWGRTVYSIFIGGGTPSLFHGDNINKLLLTIRSLVRLSPFAEITIEANPGTLDNEHIKDYSLAGVNRISIGVQSFNNNHLHTLGRIHDGDGAKKAIILAKQYFKQINLDIMYGLPNQTLSELQKDILLATEFNTTHLSFYNLTIEPNTKFYIHQPQNLPNNDECYVMQTNVINSLQQYNFKRYEISAFARDSNYCQHNLNYWLFGDYLGIGAGAHSKISFNNKIVRSVRHKHPQQYMQLISSAQHIIEEKEISITDLSFEFMLNTLRLVEGFNLKLFMERTSIATNCILPNLQKAQQQGFINIINNNVIPTAKGLDFLNELLLIFLK